MVCLFIPSLGLFSILYHSKAEQIPFYIWNRYNRSQTDKIVLYGLKETVLWGELDRWDYLTNSTHPDDGTPPHYSEYTGLSLQWTFILLFILSGAQLLSTLIVKILTSKNFSKKEHFFTKLLHLLLSLNHSSPYEDWDQGKFSVQEYRERHRQTNIEVAWCIFVNTFYSFCMLVPLLYTGSKILFLLN